MPSILLLIEKDAFLQALIETKLQDLGYHVEKASEAWEGIEKAEEDNPSLIILDMLIPGEDGEELVREFKLNPETQDIKMIIFTEDIEDIDECKGLGVDDCLIKSDFTLEELVEKVDYVLAS